MNVKSRRGFLNKQNKNRKRKQKMKEQTVEDIILPGAITGICGLLYSEEQSKKLLATLPSDKILRWCKKNDYAVIPTPPEQMSLLRIRSLQANLLYASKTSRGDNLFKMDFAQNDRTTFGWIAIRKSAVPNSMGEKLGEQKKLLTGKEFIPNVAELAWFITAYYKVRGIHLFANHVWVRTSSKLPYPRYECANVLLGGRDEKHWLEVSYNNADTGFDNYHFRNVGLASALMV